MSLNNPTFAAPTTGETISPSQDLRDIISQVSIFGNWTKMDQWLTFNELEMDAADPAKMTQAQIEKARSYTDGYTMLVQFRLPEGFKDGYD